MYSRFSSLPLFSALPQAPSVQYLCLTRLLQPFRRSIDRSICRFLNPLPPATHQVQPVPPAEPNQTVSADPLQSSRPHHVWMSAPSEMSALTVFSCET